MGPLSELGRKIMPNSRSRLIVSLARHAATSLVSCHDLKSSSSYRQVVRYLATTCKLQHIRCMGVTFWDGHLIIYCVSNNLGRETFFLQQILQRMKTFGLRSLRSSHESELQPLEISSREKLTKTNFIHLKHIANTMRPTILSTTSMLLTASTFLVGQQVDAFLAVDHRPARQLHHQELTTKTRRERGSSLNMGFLDSPSSSLLLASPLLSVVTTPSAMSTLSSAAAPFVEAEIFGDAAHVVLDLTSILRSDSLTIRIAAVVGRLLSIASDYVPDHSMLPEEFAFQGIGLWFAVAGLVKTLAPLLQVQMDHDETDAVTTLRDRKCFASLFRPAGLDWMQYKWLHAVGALEWKELRPGAIVTATDDHELCWLYRSEVLVQREDNTVQTINPTTCRLLGDLAFAAPTKASSRLSVPKMTASAGADGATVLRMDTSKLKKLMEGDRALDRGIRNILFEGMQEQLVAVSQLSY